MPDLVADLLGIGFSLRRLPTPSSCGERGRTAPLGPALQRRRNDKRKRIAAPAKTFREIRDERGAPSINDAPFTVIEVEVEERAGLAHGLQPRLRRSRAGSGVG